MSVQIVPRFSLANRLILYASFLAPAQFVSGIGNHCPSNIGFLAYNLYTQIRWLQAVMGDSSDLHALSLILPYFNLIYAVSYVAGVSSARFVWSVPLGLGTTGVLVLNTVSSWKAWAVHQPRGYGVYQFFFFGWRTLDDDWHKYFFLLWYIFDSMWAFFYIIVAIGLAFSMPKVEKEARWYHTYLAIPLGSIGMLACLGWPLILWTELIIARNQLVSETT